MKCVGMNKLTRKHFHSLAVTLPPELQKWFQVPHVTLMIGKGHESHDLGTMVAKARQVEQWTPTDNPHIHVSAALSAVFCWMTGLLCLNWQV